MYGRFLTVSTISINDLQKQSDDQWLNSMDKDDLIVTSQGQPVAVLLPINAKTLEPTLSALRSVRAVQAQAALQQAAAANGTSGLSMEDIDAEIVAARRNCPPK
jgi:antitoxin (DNA-binding transcriptional repressor) of toxin-antitoxin stability system